MLTNAGLSCSATIIKPKVHYNRQAIYTRLLESSTCYWGAQAWFRALGDGKWPKWLYCNFLQLKPFAPVKTGVTAEEPRSNSNSKSLHVGHLLLCLLGFGNHTCSAATLAGSRSTPFRAAARLNHCLPSIFLAIFSSWTCKVDQQWVWALQVTLREYCIIRRKDSQLIDAHGANNFVTTVDENYFPRASCMEHNQSVSRTVEREIRTMPWQWYGKEYAPSWYPVRISERKRRLRNGTRNRCQTCNMH